MNKTKSILFILSVVSIAILFQNCGDTQFSTSDQGSSSTSEASTSKSSNSSLSNRSNRSFAGISSLPVADQSLAAAAQASAAAAAAQASSGTTAQSSVAGVVQSGVAATNQAAAATSASAQSSVAATAQSTVTAAATQTQLQPPRPFKYTYSPNDGVALVYTGATVSDDVYVCIENSDDSSYPCRNGDPNQVFAKIPSPSAPNSPTQELIWQSDNFYTLLGIDFTDYTIFFMKKNAQGVLQDIGSTKIGFRLPEDKVFVGSSGFTSAQGGNTFSYSCVGEGSSGPNGYQSYRYSGSNCYYKISR